MTVVTRTPNRSRLSRLVDSAGGLSVRAALDGARKRLAALEPRSVEVVSGLIGDLSALPAPTGDDDPVARREDAYRIASGVIDAAALFDRADLCAAAASLCDLIDAADAEFDWRLVPVHAQAMALMLTAPADQRQALLANLAALKGRRSRSGDQPPG